MTDAGAPYRLLPWDTEFFGKRIALAESPRLDPAACRELVERARREAVECVYWLGDADDAASTDAVQRSGFRFVDVRVTLEARDAGGEARAPAGVRPFAAADVPVLERIARVSHRAARFHADPGFPDERCDELYAAWIRRSCEGWAQAVLVAGEPGRPTGYVSCHERPDGSGGIGQIGLIAVAEEARGRGLGRALTEAALAWFQGRGLRGVRVVTQGRNRGAVRMYEQSGFLCHAVQLWFHLWPLEPLPGGGG